MLEQTHDFELNLGNIVGILGLKVEKIWFGYDFCGGKYNGNVSFPEFSPPLNPKYPQFFLNSVQNHVFVLT